MNWRDVDEAGQRPTATRRQGDQDFAALQARRAAAGRAHSRSETTIGARLRAWRKGRSR